MDWLKVSVSTEREAEEIVSGVLLSAGAAGVETEGFEVKREDISPLDYADDYRAGDDKFVVCAYFACDGTEQQKVESIKGQLAQIETMDLDVSLGQLDVVTHKVQEHDWEEAWKKYFKPSKISDYVVIKPTWEPYDSTEEEIVLEIDPGMAFGTGSHETTKMCVHFLEEFLEEGGTVVDVGCGSGILSIAAAKLGAKKVYALDLDPVAVQVTEENAKRNQCEEIVEVRQSDLLKELPEDTKADIIIANIIADIVIDLTQIVIPHLKKNGMFLCSGIIESRLEDVQNALEEHGYRVINLSEDGEWRAIAAKYKG